MAMNEFVEYEDLLFEADDMIRNNRIADAINLLEDIISRVPDFGKAYNHLGWVYETKIKDYQKAILMYKQCIAYMPEYPPVYINLSIVLSQLGLYDEQKDLLQKALSVKGVDKASLHNEFAIMNELTGDYNTALEHFKEAIKYSLNDTNVDMYIKSMDRCRKKRDLL
jgi:tetratricopeptide (TPR) repeat protein